MDEFKKKLKLNKSTALLIAGAVLGLILIFGGFNSKGSKKASIPDTDSQLELTDKYVAELERRVCLILSKMDGISEVSVIITADSCVETVYAQNGRYDGGSLTQKEYVILDIDGSDSPVVIKLIYPKIRGVAVVCRGGGNPINQEKIGSLISSLLDIPSKNVYVSG